MALGRAEQRSIVAKVRVYELAKEFGVESKAVMAELEKMGEFVRSASSTIEAPVVRRLKEQFAGDSAKPARQGQRAAAPPGRRDQGDERRGDRGDRLELEPHRHADPEQQREHDPARAKQRDFPSPDAGRSDDAPRRRRPAARLTRRCDGS